ncbi:CHAT domain-containing protein [Actinosynnema sp. NPDC047251]|nr:CHAT domain-containing protein [Saccharothrix espanaensis]
MSQDIVKTLTLEAHEVDGDARWRWVLLDAAGAVVAEHEVRLDERSWQFEAFRDPHAYLRWRAAPDRRVAHEAEIVAALGAWVGDEVLGPVAAAAVACGPVAVRVVAHGDVPLPLELAHVDGKPLVLHGVCFVHAGPPAAPPEPAALPGTPKQGVRVLGLFSVPDGRQPLNLRAERQALDDLFRKIRAQGRAVDLRVLQYGATRDRLREVLADPEGWDLVHISGHGAPGELLMETAAGGPDAVSADELAALLAPARGRLGLVAVSACWSATAEQRRLLGLPKAADARAEDRPAAGGPAAGGLAAELVERLGCAVLAMRYPVTDAFATDLAHRLYRRLVGDGVPLPIALADAVREAAAFPATPTSPALSPVTPALFGGTAVDLRLPAPPAATDAGRSPAGLPRQQERFVGRVAVMARASAALAPLSGMAGVVFHGMPGSGKSACALELAHTHVDAFDDVVWFKAPDEDADLHDTLVRLVFALEAALPGLGLVHLCDDADRFTAALPALVESCAARRVLVVLDNAESLLDEKGAWRDARWAALVAALSAHGGPSRLALSSRRVPRDLDPRVRREAVDLLTVDEALLLARQLPRLGALVAGRAPGLSAGAARRLAGEVLTATSGHPKLLELADGQAADPSGFAGLLALDGADFTEVLRAWTRRVVAALDDGARAVFRVLCHVEEHDRTGFVLRRAWAGIAGGLGVDPAVLDAGPPALAEAGLVAVRTAPDGGVEYGVHPVVAGIGREDVDDAAREAMDEALIDCWLRVFADAREQESTTAGGALVSRAALAASPYLLRRGQIAVSIGFLDQALHRDDSPAVRALALPLLRRIAAVSAGGAKESSALTVLARMVGHTDPVAAERHVRRALELARDAESTGVALNALIGYRRQAGDVEEALRLTERLHALRDGADVGPVMRLVHRGNHLQLLLESGRAEEVLDEALELLDAADALPERDAAGTPRWEAREVLLNAAAWAAGQLDRHALALDLVDATIAGKRARGASPADIAEDLVNASSALKRLGRLDEAVEHLRGARAIFEQARDLRRLSATVAALATAESQRGHGEVALTLQHDALRYGYAAGDPGSLAVTHHCHGTDLGRHADDPVGGAAHHLAAALLSRFAGGLTEAGSVEDLALAVRKLGGTDALPADVAALCRVVDAVPGVDLGGLLGRLAGPDELGQALADVLARARVIAGRTRSYVPILAMWEPLVAGIVAARQGNEKAAAYVDPYLEPSASDRPRLAAFRRIRAGADEVDPAGLDDVDTAVVNRLLDAVTGRDPVRTELWPAMSFGPLMGDLVKAVGESNAAAAQRAREDLDRMLADPDDAPLASVLEHVLAGDFVPEAADVLANPADFAVVITVLEYLAR